MDFNSFNFNNYINQALKEINFNKPTEIQSKVIPLVQSGKDVIGNSFTGSGKTHAFLLPILNYIDPSIDNVQAVITSPTRELATQIFNFAKEIADYSQKEIRILLAVGGTDRVKLIKKVEANQPHIVVGTPGRIKDLVIDENVLKAYTSKFFVVDEADMALDSGFIDDIDAVAGTMDENLQMLVFSATIPEKLKPFLRKYLNNPELVQVNANVPTPEKLDHILIPTRHKDKKQLLLRLFKCINPFMAIVFANKRTTVSEIAEFLRDKGIKVGEIHGNLTTRQRSKIMKEIHELKYQYIVATDIAARGIDIEGVTHIINYELPYDYEFYIHRCGRTARNKYEGVALTFYDKEDDEFLNLLDTRNIEFSYKEIKNGMLVDSRIRNERSKREKRMTDLDYEAMKRVRKPKKVKPGYKKKAAEKIEREKKKLKKQRGRWKK